MGQVFRAHAVETGELVAIKTIRTDLLGNESVIALFKREAAALRQIHHEAIVRYFLFTVDRRLHVAYLAMEFVQGEPLGKFVAKGKLSVDETLALMRRVAEGMSAAHAAGVVHRDISPDNIIIPGGNVSRARIIDFGIAKNALSEGTLIGPDGFVGKLRYASPEQFGQFGATVNEKSDIYSLGLVLAGCVLGKPVEMGRDLGEAIARRMKEPDLTGVDERIRPLLSWMTQPDPDKRPADMRTVMNWQPAPAVVPETRVGRTGWRWAVGGLAGVTALAGIAAWLLWPPTLQVSPVVAFVRGYDGGPCFMAAVTGETPKSADVDGFGAEIAPFNAFDTAFKTKFGFEATVNLRQTTAAQCPALALASSLRNAAISAPQLKLKDTRVAQGENLDVTVTSEKPTALFVVREDGTMSRLPGTFGGGGETIARIPARRVLNPQGQPQIVLGIAGSDLSSLDGIGRQWNASSQTAEQISKALSARSGQYSAALAYYKVN